MSPNILVTGAAGYIGGSIVADFLAGRSNIKIEKENLNAAVRSDEQAEALSKLGINVLQLNLTDEKAVVKSLARHNISIVVHTASSINPSLVLNLITALGKQQEASGEKSYYIHTSGSSAFFPRTGWPVEEMNDSGPVFDKEKELADSFPIRKTDVTAIEHAKAQGVTSFVVVPPVVYGKGSGTWNQLSVVLPVLVQAGIARKQVYRFPEDTELSTVHISDFTALYGLIVQKILQKEAIPSGTEGYYFGVAHNLTWWEVLDKMAEALNARGLVANSKTQIWPSDEVAAESLGVPTQFVQPLWNSGAKFKAEKGQKIGWKPEWNRERFLQNVDDEIEAVLELGKAKSSLIDSLFAAASRG